jgi:hypothetical protein
MPVMISTLTPSRGTPRLIDVHKIDDSDDVTFDYVKLFTLKFQLSRACLRVSTRSVDRNRPSVRRAPCSVFNVLSHCKDSGGVVSFDC